MIIMMSIMAVHILSNTSPALDSASDMHCGTEIVSVGASRFDVKEKCGEPTSIELGQGYGTEQWIYNLPGPGSAAAKRRDPVVYLRGISWSASRYMPYPIVAKEKKAPA